MVKKLTEEVRRFNRRSIARAISILENSDPSANDLLHELYPHTGQAYRVGITGPPGAGKSTITNRLAGMYRADGKKIGIIAVDPTSPFTGGALLGDRVRMTDVELDQDVFIRSMASRGSLGGLSKRTSEAADVLDAAGCDIIFLETVGVGQSELDIAQAADTTVVVLVPESGDSIQAMKAGLMEIADLFVLNKSDRPGAEQVAASITMILGMRIKPSTDTQEWHPTVVQATAIGSEPPFGVREMIERHRAFLTQDGSLAQRRSERLKSRIHEIILDTLQSQFWDPGRERLLNEKIAAVLERSLTPYEIAEELLSHFENRRADPKA